MDTVEAMAALLVLMALADLLVDSTEVNLADILADLAVARVVLGGHDGIQSEHSLSQQPQITKDTQCPEKQAIRIESFITYISYMTQTNKCSIEKVIEYYYFPTLVQRLVMVMMLFTRFFPSISCLLIRRTHTTAGVNKKPLYYSLLPGSW